MASSKGALLILAAACLLAGCAGPEVKSESEPGPSPSQALQNPDLPPEVRAELERQSREEQARVAEAQRAAEERAKAQAGS